MKYILHIVTLLIGFTTAFCIWMYIQRANLNYNANGKYFSIQDGVVYHEQTKEVYGMLSILGLILIGILIYKWVKNG